MGRYINKGRYAGVTSSAVSTGGRIYITASAGSNSGCCAFTIPSNVTCATFELWGGGGAGSPSCCCTCWGGEPGAGGAYALKTIPVTPGDTYTICVGQGGCGSASWFQSNACGCPGLKTFVTGTGLTNLCANGGAGGNWCNAYGVGGTVGCALSYGGDICLYGRPGSIGAGCCWQGGTGFQIGGSSPLGGGRTIESRASGSCADPSSCAVVGSFPGGGGLAKPMFTSGWCDCFAGCNSAGADGLVIISM